MSEAVDYERKYRGASGSWLPVQGASERGALPAQNAASPLYLDSSHVLYRKLLGTTSGQHKPVQDGKPSARAHEQAAPFTLRSNAGRGWRIWDYIVTAGAGFAVIGAILPLITDFAAASVLFPIGAVLLAFGGFKSRQNNS